MAKLRWNTDYDSDLVKFGSLKDSEVFIADGLPCMKTNRLASSVSAVNLTNGDWLILNDDDLVTYVQRAELKLTI